MEWPDDDPELIWRSNKLNDLGYICPDCGNIPTFRELKNGWCTDCRNSRIDPEDSNT